MKYVERDVAISACFNDKEFLTCPFEKVPNLDMDGQDVILCLDPSSKQTGVVIGDLCGNIKLILDFKNRLLKVNEYKSLLNDYLERLVKTMNVKFFVYEVPFTPGKKDLASSVLGNLESMFKEYYKVLPSLTKSGMFPILPAVWRKNYFKDKCYDGKRKERALLKEIAREEAVKRYPEFKRYFWQDPTYPPDSTDAIGIYHGFLEEYWFDRENNIRRVSKANSRYSRNHTFNYEVFNGVSSEDLLQKIQSKFDMTTVDTYAFNSDYSLNENIEIVTSNTNNLCLLYGMDNLSLELLRWEFKGNATLSNLVLACQRNNKLK